MSLKHWDYMGTNWAMLIQVPLGAINMEITDATIQKTIGRIAGTEGSQLGVDDASKGAYKILVKTTSDNTMTLAQFGEKLVTNLQGTFKLNAGELENNLMIKGLQIKRTDDTPANVAINPFDPTIATQFYVTAQ